MSRGPDSGVLLERALRGAAERGGVVLAIADAGWTAWASATFVGARHRLVLHAAAGDAFDRWLAELPEAELPMRRHLVAELAVTARWREDGAACAILEVLTVEADCAGG